MQTTPLTRKLKVLSVFGTRPEAIKMAPVVKGLEAEANWIESKVCVTAQHRQMLDQVLQLFDITPDFDLDLMKPNQDLFHITTAVLNGMKPILETEKPDIVLVHGDTTTSFATSLACYYLQIPVGHVEAGLRTYNSQFPFPEELNRVVTDAIGTLFFAPTEQSKQNLLALRGGNPKGIFVTGNTVIDALFQTLNAPVKVPSPVTLKEGNRLVLATVHRRENFGEPLQAILKAMLHLLEQFPDVELALPVHPNPNVKPLVEATLGQHERIHLLAPQEYEPFCRLMQQACLILTDSGGVQEEAPSLGIPVLVLRDETERPEAVEAGTVKLVGPHYEQIVAEASKLLGDGAYYQAMQRATNPYGDGQAVRRIVKALHGFWELKL
jgi:UDP-N-acetylglucosamine 2-epimerase (non-hydrolysing)